MVKISEDLMNKDEEERPSEENGFSKKFMYFCINKIVPFKVILEKAGFENYNYQGNVFCPFHDNTDTPAAKMFDDEDGDRLYCFTERRMYRPADVIKQGLMKKRLAKIFYNIWKQLSGQQKDYLKDEYGKPQEFLTSYNHLYNSSTASKQIE